MISLVNFLGVKISFCNVCQHILYLASVFFAQATFVVCTCTKSPKKFFAQKFFFVTSKKRNADRILTCGNDAHQLAVFFVVTKVPAKRA